MGEETVRSPEPARPRLLDEVRDAIRMRGTKWLMASLLYGAGLRLRECLKLRVKDVDFEYRQIVVRDGKDAKDADRWTRVVRETVTAPCYCSQPGIHRLVGAR